MTTARLTLDAFIPYRLSITSNLVSDAIARAYHAMFGLKIPEWRIIAVVAESADGITQQEIGTRTRMDKVTVSRAAIALVERGLIARTRNPRDQRSHLLVLTAEGRRLYDAIAPEALALERRMLDGFTQDEIATLVAFLHRIDETALMIGKAAPRDVDV